MFFKPKKELSANQKFFAEQHVITAKILKSANALIKAIIDESNVIKSGKLSDLKGYLQSKIDHHNAFVANQEELSRHVLEYGLDKDDKNIELLKAAMYTLGVENKKNEILAKIAMETSEKIVNAYKVAQVEASVRNSGYDKEGRIPGTKIAKKSPPSSSLNDKC